VRRRHAQRLFDDALPDLIDLLALCIAGGSHPVTALAELGSLAPAPTQHLVGLAGGLVERGARSSELLMALAEVGGPSFAPVVDTLIAADRYGLAVADVLQRLADEARATRRRRAEARTRELPVRLAAPLVLCTLPSFVLLAVVPLVLGALSSLQW
jgi:pilus assembly protein TadC